MDPASKQVENSFTDQRLNHNKVKCTCSVYRIFLRMIFLLWLTSFCHDTIVWSNSIAINFNWIRWAKTFFTCLKNIDNVIHLSINIPGKLSTTFLFFFLTEAVPGNIRQAEHFVNFMRRFIEYLKVCSTLLLPKIFRWISFFAVDVPHIKIFKQEQTDALTSYMYLKTLSLSAVDLSKETKTLLDVVMNCAVTIIWIYQERVKKIRQGDKILDFVSHFIHTMLWSKRCSIFLNKPKKNVAKCNVKQDCCRIK